MPKFTHETPRPDPTRDEIVHALLHSDRAQHDELGRTRSMEMSGDTLYHASPREQGAAPIDLHNVDE